MSDSVPALGRHITTAEKLLVNDFLRDESLPARIAMLANRDGRLRNRHRRFPASGVSKLAKRAARGTMRRDNFFDAVHKNIKAFQERNK